ncbi:hypothetical protein [Ciceribacter sp. L1K22]|uniref:hypothetical protein n=1 Tax=Ciceribacter sp. L1K22 TaxID=2820275 RepID=UPI001ABE4DAA|nr:hypothetical protein [Ciceribacter sp. L1K22]MBO3759202.1 hypothetical protein [Ciceribacter sp. L1K22]
MASILMLTAATRRERNDATSFVFDAINACGGWIEDVHMYSNKMTTVRLALPGTAIEDLIGSLIDGGIAVDPPEAPASSDDRERRVTLQLTFLHDEPDLMRDIPAIPG